MRRLARIRLVRALDTLINPGEIHLATLAVGLATIALIILLERTRLGPLGLVIAVVATSAVPAVLGWTDVATLNDLGVVPNSLPRLQLPTLELIPVLIIPALSLAFVGLIQGASISANYPNPDGSYPDVSRDFQGQGVANVAAGLFQGMPVGGSLSASAINKVAGARTRQSLVIASGVMAVVILLFGGVVGYVAMPALAGLLILVGYRTIKPADLWSVWRTGSVQKVVLVVTFGLTLIIPLQYAVLVGVGVSAILFVVRQSNQITIKRRRIDEQGDAIESDPPADLPANEVVILQPYGSLFFAAAPVFESLLPKVTDGSRNSVVILRMRGRSDLGTTFLDVLYRYAVSLKAVDSKLVIVSTNERVEEQLEVAGIFDVVDAADVLRGNERVGGTLRSANTSALAWVESRKRADWDSNPGHED